MPGLPGKGIVDLGIHARARRHPGDRRDLYDLGFGPQPGADPGRRPGRCSSARSDRRRGLRLHCHVCPERDELERDIAFRDALRADPELSGPTPAQDRRSWPAAMIGATSTRTRRPAWISDVLRGSASAAADRATGDDRHPGWRPARADARARRRGRWATASPSSIRTRRARRASVADRIDRRRLRRRRARPCAWRPVRRRHLRAGARRGAVVDAVEPCDPGPAGTVPARGDAGPAWPSGASSSTPAFAVAPWREVRTDDDLRAAAAGRARPAAPAQGGDRRVRRPRQLRLGDRRRARRRIDRLGRRPATPQLAERELAFEAEISVIVARGTEGRMATFPIARNVHDAGILVESVAPAPVSPEVAERAAAIGERLATAMGLVGTLTAELFLIPDGRSSSTSSRRASTTAGTGRSKAPRRRSSSSTSGRSAGCRWARRMCWHRRPIVNVLGEGRRRPARSDRRVRRSVGPDVHLHLYDKRDVFERRKMGHVTALGAMSTMLSSTPGTPGRACAWADEPDGGDGDRDKEGDAR